MVEDAMTRWQTVESLAASNDTQAVPTLIAMLDDEDTVVRLATIRALGLYADVRAIPRLIEALRSGNIETSRMAAYALGNIGVAAVPALTQTLHDFVDNEWVGEPTVCALGHTGDERAIPALLDALCSPVYEVAQGAAQALGEFGAASLAPLLDMMGDDTRASWHAMHALRRLGEIAVIPLLDVLKTGNALARQRAIEALHLLGDTRARDAFVQALDDEEPEVRQEAAIALSEYGNARGLPLLLDALSKRGLHRATIEMNALERLGEAAFETLRDVVQNEQQAVVFRYHALIVLGKLANDVVVPLLLTMIQDSNALLRQGAIASLRARRFDDAAFRIQLLASLQDESRDVRIAAMVTLGDIKEERAIIALIPVLTDTPEDAPDLREQIAAIAAFSQLASEIRLDVLKYMLEHRPRLSRYASNALRNVGAQGMAVLFSMLHHEQEHVRVHVVYALAYTQGSNVTPQLCDALLDTSVKVRREAANALGHLKNNQQQAIEPLIAALSDKDETVRAYAAQSLGQIGDEQAIPALMSLQHVTSENTKGFGVKEACVRAIMHIKHWW